MSLQRAGHGLHGCRKTPQLLHVRREEDFQIRRIVDGLPAQQQWQRLITE